MWLWQSKGPHQWPAQPTVVQPSMSICVEKEQCRQGLVPAVGHGTEKIEDKNNSSQKNSFGNDGAQNPLQIPLKVCFGRRPHGMSWPF